MRLAALAAAAFILAGACGFGTPASPVTLNLRDHQAEVPIDKVLRFDFASAVDPNAAEAAISFRPAIDGNFTALPGGRALTFEPLAWADETAYTVRVAAFNDLKGNPVAAAAWTFTTTILPRIVGVKDSAGNAVGAFSQVELGGSLQVTFNTPMSAPDTAFLLNSAQVRPTFSDDGLTATVPLAGIPVGPSTLILQLGEDRHGHVADLGWTAQFDVAYEVHIQTTHLPFPALVQIPNDGYGARPQVGIQAAAMVFEYQTEGSIQRLTALYTDVPAVVGPTRSARRISLRLVSHYQGNLFLSGMSNDLHNFFLAHPVPAWWDNPPGYYRDPSRYAPNNLMLRGDAVAADEAASKTPASAPLDYGTPQLSGGAAAPTFEVAEHRTQYTYDPVTGTYGKVEDGDTMTDASLNKPDQIFMVLVLHTREFLVSDIENGCCTHGRDFDLDSGGGLDIYYRGQHYPGTWASPGPTSPLQFKTADGQPLTFPRGLVWVDVVGS